MSHINIPCFIPSYLQEGKISKIFMDHQLKVATSEILDFEGHKYEEVDYFGWLDMCSMPSNT